MTSVARAAILVGALAGAIVVVPRLIAQAPPARPVSNPRALDARLAALQKEAAALAGERQTLLGRLRQLQVARETRLVELERTNAALARVPREVDDASRRVAAIEAELGAITPEIRDRLVRMYKLLPLGYDRLLLSLDQARSVDRAARVIAVIARRDRSRLERFQQLRQQRRTEVLRLQTEQATLEGLKARLQSEEAALADAGTAQATLLRSIRERREVNAQLVDELTAARDRLDRSVSTLRPAVPADYAGSGPPRPGIPPPGLGVSPGRMDWPVAGRLETRFGREASSRFGTVIVRNGVEIGAATGTPVRAVQAGRVAFADAFVGFGRVVILDHGAKAYTLYGHLATIDVKKDDRLDRGQVIGSVGTAPTGAATLYFEVRVDGRPVDPVQWLRR